MNQADLKNWIGRSTELTDLVSPAPLRLMAATLDYDEAMTQAASSAALRPLWHWLYFLPGERQSGIGPDGHPQRGGFLPPVPLPRRMWAGGRLEFVQALQPGEAIRRVSRIASVQTKSGRTGSLVFVCVVHEIFGPQGLAVREEHDIVYRDLAPAVPVGTGEPSAAPTSRPAPTDEHYARTICPDPVLLFRYSALTFNGHRIHYDRSYVTDVEGYPGLIVHGPLIATLLLEELQRQAPQTRIKSFEFKAISPLFDTAPFEVCGKLEGETAHLWARGPQGQLAMQATARVA